jgi:UDP-glucose 4-epimerase
MAKILITGTTGFIGSRLALALQARHEIFGLSRRLPKNPGYSKVHWVEQDFTRPLEYKRLPEHVDVIIHLAQSKLYKQFPAGARDIFDINIHGTFELLEYAREVGIECMILASSGGMYGNSYEKFVETDPVNPLNFYLSSKYTAELLLANYQSFFRTVVFRFFFVYGPGQRGMLIPNLLKKVINNEPILIDGNPGLRINPIYIEDAIRVFEPAFHLPTSELFNIAGNETMTLTDLVSLMGEVSCRKPSVQHNAIPIGGDLIGDNTHMKEMLGIIPKVSLRDGMKAMVKFFLDEKDGKI